jgi:hypothetical protein
MALKTQLFLVRWLLYPRRYPRANWNTALPDETAGNASRGGHRRSPTLSTDHTLLRFGQRLRDLIDSDARVIPSQQFLPHGRGHRFDPCRAHHAV